VGQLRDRKSLFRVATGRWFISLLNPTALAWDFASAARSLSLMEGACGQRELLVMAQLFTLACLPRLPTLHNRIYGGCRIRMSAST
jgi:hypothetical protein